MEFDPKENRKDFKKMIFIIVGILVFAVAVTAFLLIRKGSKENFDLVKPNSESLTTSQIPDEKKSLYSSDISTWKNYNWSGKVNTHFPSNWKIQEDINNVGLITGLEIIPPTENTEDTIFIGGDSVKCSNISKYTESKCLKNKIQVPFYTNSKNEEVLSAFNLIYQNTILTDEEK